MTRRRPTSVGHPKGVMYSVGINEGECVCGVWVARILSRIRGLILAILTDLRMVCLYVRVPADTRDLGRI